MNIGIIGCGHIAAKMAVALNGISNEVTLYAIASRSIDKAIEFKDKYNVVKAYGSYLELVMDSNIDLVYIATPHSEHYSHAKLCLENGKNCLVEKAFTGNMQQAKELVELAKRNKLLLAEAMWTRYLPSRWQIKAIIESSIGNIKSMETDFSIPISNVARLSDPKLCGGALLDLGVYSLTTPILYLGWDFQSIKTSTVYLPTGVDATTNAILEYPNGVIAKAKCSCIDRESNYCKIVGDKGYMVFGPINAPEYIDIYDNRDNKIDSISIEYRVNGYEYQILEIKRMLEEGKKECDSMPLSETIRMMGLLDSIRYTLDVVYPFEKDMVLNKPFDIEKI